MSDLQPGWLRVTLSDDRGRTLVVSELPPDTSYVQHFDTPQRVSHLKIEVKPREPVPNRGLLFNPVRHMADADDRARQWALAGHPSHPFVGETTEPYCRVCAGGRDGIQHA